MVAAWIRRSSSELDGTSTGDDDFGIVDAARAVANERGAPPARVALAWLLSKPAVTAPIVGATKLHHLKDAIAVCFVEQEAEAELAGRLDDIMERLNTSRPAPGRRAIQAHR